MDRVKVASLLEEIVMQVQDIEDLTNSAALILKEIEEEDDEAAEWCDRFIAHALRREEFSKTISKLVAALQEGDEA
jgi:hypothetical protein